MIRILAFLLTGCWHRWETINSVPLKWESDFGAHGRGQRYTLRCKRCGAIKKQDLR